VCSKCSFDSSLGHLRLLVPSFFTFAVGNSRIEPCFIQVHFYYPTSWIIYIHVCMLEYAGPWYILPAAKVEVTLPNEVARLKELGVYLSSFCCLTGLVTDVPSLLYLILRYAVLSCRRCSFDSSLCCGRCDKLFSPNEDCRWESCFIRFYSTSSSWLRDLAADGSHLQTLR
jgi:hypothetical protein